MFQDQGMDKRASDQVKKKKKKNPRSPISTQFKVGPSPSTVKELTKPAFNLNSTGTEEMT